MFWIITSVVLAIFLLISIATNSIRSKELEKTMHTNVFLYSKLIQQCKDRDEEERLKHEINYIQKKFSSYDTGGK